MKTNPEIFKTYDVRGVFGRDFDQEGAYSIGRAFVDFLGKKNPKIAVGRDNRISSPELFGALSRGITEGGGTVFDIGLATTPLLYFSVVKLKADGGINITASHNPAQYNGFKLTREKAIPVSGETGLMEIRNIALESDFKQSGKGKIVKKDTTKDYVKFNLKDFKKGRPLKIVIDTANAVSGIMVPKIFGKMGHEIIHIFSELDGTFPNHNPDPLVKDNLRTICDAVREKNADLGVAFDGDGDRMFLIDEKGEVVAGDMIIALMTDSILKKNPEENIIYDIRSSNVIQDVARENGGTAIGGRIGHTLIKEAMRKNNTVFAGELSGHYYFRDHYFCESPFAVLAEVMKQMADKKLSEIIKPYQKYFHSGEINFEVEDKKRALDALEERFGKEGRVSKIDGLRVDFSDWWFLVRSSNTEPVIRLVLEAKDKETLDQKTHLLSDILHS